uniref:Uncharacterized protein n=1 Tax=Arundo donax TaxID=35708 RepID=A0A0A9E906_ARUDO
MRARDALLGGRRRGLAFFRHQAVHRRRLERFGNGGFGFSLRCAARGAHHQLVEAPVAVEVEAEEELVELLLVLVTTEPSAPANCCPRRARVDLISVPSMPQALPAPPPALGSGRPPPRRIRCAGEGRA